MIHDLAQEGHPVSDPLRQASSGPPDDVAQLHERIAALEEELRRQSEAAQRISGSHDRLKLILSVSQRQMDEITKVHAQMLPRQFPLLGGLTFAAHCRPCADVGGDFYDVFQLPDGRVGICMADVSGHGAMAAVSMATTRSLLRVALMEAQPFDGPSELLGRLSHWFGVLLDAEQFVTMWLGIYDPESNFLQAASAAHPPVVLWRRGGEPEYLSIEPTIPLGLAGLTGPRPEEASLLLKPGDRLFLYTDCWNETPSRDGQVLAGNDFLHFVANAEGQPLETVPLFLFTEFERHAAGTRIRDDLSLLVFDRRF